MEAVFTSRSPLTRRRWLSFSLRTLAIVMAISAVLLARYAAQIRDWWNGPQSQFQVIETAGGLHEALAAERSAIYCDVQWSIDAARGRRVFHELVRVWKQGMPGTPVHFYLLDLTDRESDVVKEAVALGFNASTGSGELLWIRDGKPRVYSQGLGGYSQSDLADIAQRAFDLPVVALRPQPNPISGSASR